MTSRGYENLRAEYMAGAKVSLVQLQRAIENALTDLANDRIPSGSLIEKAAQYDRWVVRASALEDLQLC